MNRRSFLALGAAAGAGLAATGLRAAAESASPAGAPRFRLKYAPHPGMFKENAGEDLVDQIRFSADQGFTAFEDNGMGGRPIDVQEKAAAAMQRLGLTFGVFVAMADFKNVTFASRDPANREAILALMRSAVEVAKRTGARWTTVVPGCYDTRLEWDFQTAAVVDNLRFCAELCEPAGLVMVLEPLNTRRDHPGVFLQTVPQAYEICRAVNSPSCKILYDLYHAQIQLGNLVPNLDLAWSETAYVQIGDNPGRKEPGTGEINYRHIFGHLHAKGYQGVLGMEHGNSRPGKEGELAVIRAYREADRF